MYMELLEGWNLRDLEVEGYDSVRVEELEPIEYGGLGDHALDIGTVEEHVSRHGGSHEYVFNEAGKDIIRADMGDRKLEVVNEDSGMTVVKMGSDRYSVDRIYEEEIGKLIERERKRHMAAELLSSTVAESQDDPVSYLETELEELGPGLQQVAERYFMDPGEEGPAPLSEVYLPYAFFFELGENSSVNDNYHEALAGEMPLGEALEDEEKRSRGVYWMKRYLESGLERTILDHGKGEGEGGLRELLIGGTDAIEAEAGPGKKEAP